MFTCGLPPGVGFALANFRVHGASLSFWAAVPSSMQFEFGDRPDSEVVLTTLSLLSAKVYHPGLPLGSLAFKVLAENSST